MRAFAHRNEIVSCDLLYIPVEMEVSNISSTLLFYSLNRAIRARLSDSRYFIRSSMQLPDFALSVSFVSLAVAGACLAVHVLYLASFHRCMTRAENNTLYRPRSLTFLGFAFNQYANLDY